MSKQQKPTPLIQGVFLKNVLPKSDFKIMNQGLKMIWEGSMQPTNNSEAYRIRITYIMGKKPIIRVVSPILQSPEGELLPHTYSHEKQELCLYYPPNNEWHSGLIIAKTILPWASEWLFYYEIWAITGEWQGGGKHTESSKKKEKFSTIILKKL